MHNQNKLLRLLQLISVLQASPAKTMKTIAKLIGSTERFVYSVRNDKNLTQNLTQTSRRNRKGPTI